MDAGTMRNGDERQVRVLLDGCFDLIHFGHANAVRQAREMGDYLVVSVHASDAIEEAKHAPIYTDSERCRLAKALKWVDQIVECTEYGRNTKLLKRYNCQFVVHGDDPVTSQSGVDYYAEEKVTGKYRECRRTPGISTTDIIQRIKKKHEDALTSEDQQKQCNQDVMSFPTAQLIGAFSCGKSLSKRTKIVYAAGAFDVFHIGHLSFLEKAAKEGDYLIVGVHSDKVVSQRKGNRYPILNNKERALTVLAFKCVSDVLFDAPFCITNELLEHFRVDVVCCDQPMISMTQDELVAFQVPIKKNMLREVDSGCTVTTESIVRRVVGSTSADANASGAPETQHTVKD